MLFLPTFEPGVRADSTYYFTPPDKKTADNLFYSGLTGHFFVDARYQFSHNMLEEVKYPGGITLSEDGRYYSSKNDLSFDLRYIAFLPISGNMMLIANDIYTFGNGQIALFDKQKGHSYCSLGNTETYFIMFDGCCSDMLVEDLVSGGNIFNTQTMGSVHNIFKELHSTAENGRSIHPIVHSAMIHDLLSLLYQSFEFDTDAPQKKISDCVNYINGHYKDELNLELLAQMSFLSVSHFLRSFKDEIGVTPYEYLLQVRFAVAKNQLATTKKSVKEIAFDVGFNSDVHFMNTFKKRFGMTPSAFRKASQQGEERIF